MADWFNTTRQYATPQEIATIAKGGGGLLGSGLQALSGAGDIANDMIKREAAQKELDMRIAADKRAQEQLDLQKTQYADQQAAKLAGTEYMNSVKQAMAKSLTPVQDARIDNEILSAPNTGPLTKEQVDAFKAELAMAQDVTRKDPKAMMEIAYDVAAPTNAGAELVSSVLDRTVKPLQDEVHQNRSHEQAVAVMKETEKLREAAEKRKEGRDEAVWDKRLKYEEAKAKNAAAIADKKVERDQTDKALSELSSFQASLNALKESDPNNKDLPMMQKELDSMMADIKKDYTEVTQADGTVRKVPVSIQAITKSVESLKDRAKTLGTYKHEKDKEADKEMKLLDENVNKATEAWAWNKMNFKPVVEEMTKGLGEADKKALQTRYPDSTAGLRQLIADVKEKAPEKLPAIQAAFKRSDYDAYLSANTEDDMQAIFKDRDLVDKLMGVKLNRKSLLTPSAGSDYSLGTD